MAYSLHKFIAPDTPRASNTNCEATSRSAMTPMGRLGRPEELNGLAVFLASEASGFVTGANILADVS